MTVTITKLNLPTTYEIRIPARQYNRRDDHQCYLVLDRKTGRKLIEVKFRYSDSNFGSTVHCLLWIYDKTNGYAKAGGYGYCKTSTAFANALRAAGIETVGLEGTGRITETLEELATVFGFTDSLITDVWF